AHVRECGRARGRRQGGGALSRPVVTLRQHHRCPSSDRRRTDPVGAPGGRPRCAGERPPRIRLSPPGCVPSGSTPVGRARRRLLPQSRRRVVARRARAESVTARLATGAVLLAALVALFAYKIAAKMPDFEVYWRGGGRAGGPRAR